MANVHAEYLTENEVRDAALPILQKRFGKFGFTELIVKEEEDFDGAHIFRATATVEERVPARDLIDVVGDIHAILRKKGEQRFVYLSTARPDDGDGEDFEQ